MLTFQEAAKLGQKRLANNLYLEPSGRDWVVRFYATNIIRMTPDGNVVLAHGQWITKTTGSCIVCYCPLLVGLSAKPKENHFVVTYLGKTYIWPKQVSRIRLTPKGVQKWSGRWVKMKEE